MSKTGLKDEEFEQTIIQRIQPEGPDTRDNMITVSDVFNLLAQGFKTKAIRKLRPEIRPETVALARAFIIAKYPDIYREKIGQKSMADYKLLVDENISARIIPAVRNGFGWASHTNFVDLKGRGKSHATGDQDVWQWAVHHNIDAILTRDSNCKDNNDLTKIALDAALDMMGHMDRSGKESVNLDELPLIVHVKGSRHDYKSIAALFVKHHADIVSYLETRTTPYIEVRENGVTAGPTYTELWAQYLKQVNKDYEVIPRKERWKDQWKKAILRGRSEDELPEDQRRRIDDMVKASAAICAMPATPRLSRLARSRLGVRPEDAYLP